MSSERPKTRLPDPYRVPPPTPMWLKVFVFVALAFVCVHPMLIWWLNR